LAVSNDLNDVSEASDKLKMSSRGLWQT